MTSQVIPAEAVEAAAKVTQEVCESYDPGGWAEGEKFEAWAKLILEAAAPYMLTEAWGVARILAGSRLEGDQPEEDLEWAKDEYQKRAAK